MVEAAMSIGVGFSQLREFFAAMDIRNISRYVYEKAESNVGKKVRHAAKCSMAAAAKNEIALAIERGESTDSDGFYCIPVVVDGGWCKRSYGHSYSANSGVGVIIGLCSNQVLYSDVRNKFCARCVRHKNHSPSSHECTANWSGTAQAMERDIIVAGFRASEDSGLRYTELVGDGDSSVYVEVQTSVSYGPRVKKIDCLIHLIKNVGKKLYQAHGDTKAFVGPEGVKVRKIVSRDNIQSLQNLCTATVRRFSSMVGADPMELRRQLLNAPYHLFHQHANCPSDVCPVKRGDCCVETGTHETLELLKRTGMFDRILSAVSFLADHANTVMKNLNSNYAELFMSTVCKMVGGKRVDFSKGAGYANRCFSSVLSYNSKGPAWHDNFHATLSEPSASGTTPMKRLAASRASAKQAKRRCLAKKKALLPKRLGPIFSANVESKQRGASDYGPDARKPPISSDILAARISEHTQRIQIETPEKQSKLCQSTIGQFSNELYKIERGLRLSSTNFYDVGRKHQKTFDYGKLVSKIMYSTFAGTRETRYGALHEKDGVAAYIERHPNRRVQASGLFVSLSDNYLCASPDGFVDEDGLIEVKCPASALDEAVVPFGMLAAIAEKHNIGIKKCKKGAGCLCLSKSHR
jgi:hypothetical protein